MNSLTAVRGGARPRGLPQQPLALSPAAKPASLAREIPVADTRSRRGFAGPTDADAESAPEVAEAASLHPQLLMLSLPTLPTSVARAAHLATARSRRVSAGHSDADAGSASEEDPGFFAGVREARGTQRTKCKRGQAENERYGRSGAQCVLYWRQRSQGGAALVAPRLATTAYGAQDQSAKKRPGMRRAAKPSETCFVFCCAPFHTRFDLKAGEYRFDPLRASRPGPVERLIALGCEEPIVQNAATERRTQSLPSPICGSQSTMRKWPGGVSRVQFFLSSRLLRTRGSCSSTTRTQQHDPNSTQTSSKLS